MSELNKMNQSWNPFFESKQSFLEELFQKIKFDSICPENNRIFRFAETDLNSVKIVILGQDPYPQKGAASGRAFEVSGLKNWTDPFRQISLKNILRLIFSAYNGECIKWNELKNQIINGSFPILSPDRLFSFWEQQGVLLLNSSLTCRENEPLSHQKLWQPFTEELIEYISKNRPDLIWFLWGNGANSIGKNANGKHYCSRHPMLCGGDCPDDFLKNPCFLETKHIIDWTGGRS
ncbi:MAG: uracil-DNA glycosylase [Clostridiales bacterium]|nr:uracil-DNA glycosylase [Clostridiales bacterium]